MTTSIAYKDIFVKDEDAFLFIIRSNDKLQKVPKIYNMNNPQRAIRHNGGPGPVLLNIKLAQILLVH